MIMKFTIFIFSHIQCKRSSAKPNLDGNRAKRPPEAARISVPFRRYANLFIYLPIPALKAKYFVSTRLIYSCHRQKSTKNFVVLNQPSSPWSSVKFRGKKFRKEDSPNLPNNLSLVKWARLARSFFQRHRIYDCKPGCVRYTFGHYPTRNPYYPTDVDWEHSIGSAITASRCSLCSRSCFLPNSISEFLGSATRHRARL